MVFYKENLIDRNIYKNLLNIIVYLNLIMTGRCVLTEHSLHTVSTSIVVIEVFNSVQYLHMYSLAVHYHIFYFYFSP